MKKFVESCKPFAKLFLLLPVPFFLIACGGGASSNPSPLPTYQADFYSHDSCALDFNSNENGCAIAAGSSFELKFQVGDKLKGVSDFPVDSHREKTVLGLNDSHVEVDFKDISNCPNKLHFEPASYSAPVVTFDSLTAKDKVDVIAPVSSLSTCVHMVGIFAGAHQIGTVKVLISKKLTDQRQFLVDFYHDTGGGAWTNHSDWLSAKPMSQWYGIKTVPGSESVLSIQMPSNHLAGALPSDWQKISTSALIEVSLPHNQLSSGVPSSLTALKRLSILNLSYNKLTGSVPGNFPFDPVIKIFSIALQHNDLTGDLPGNYGKLKFLNLDLSNNKLSGSIPQGFFPSDSGAFMVTVSLAHNQLDGLPVFASGAPIGSLNLSSNDISGTLPESVGNLTDAGVLNFSSNDLSGLLPVSLGNLTNRLKDLDLSNNGALGSGSQKLPGTLCADLSQSGKHYDIQGTKIALC